MILKKAPDFFELEAVIAYIFNLRGELLLLQKTLGHSLYPGMWGTCAGKIQSDEDKISAAKREILEETNNNIASSEIICLDKSFPTVHCVYATGQPIIFRAHMVLCSKPLNTIRISSEHKKFYWVSVSDILSEKFNLIPDMLNNFRECLPLIKKHRPIPT